MKASEFKSAESGLSYLEIIVVLGIVGMTFAVTLSALAKLYRQASRECVVSNVRAVISEASSKAVFKAHYIGIVFKDSKNGITAALYEDGDGDGINRQDISENIDRSLGSSVLLDEPSSSVSIPLNVTRGPGGEVLSHDNPVRFGRGDILSFSPEATATPGSVYISDQDGKVVWAFRVTGLGGRVRTFRWFKGKWNKYD